MNLGPVGELVVVEALETVLSDIVGGENTDTVLELGELRIGHEATLELADGTPAILVASALPTGKRRLGSMLAAELERRGYEIRRIP